MRRTWIAIVMIALAAGLVAMYRSGRAAKTPREVKIVARETEPAAPSPPARDEKRRAATSRESKSAWPRPEEFAPVKPYYEPKSQPGRTTVTTTPALADPSSLGRRPTAPATAGAPSSGVVGRPASAPSQSAPSASASRSSYQQPAAPSAPKSAVADDSAAITDDKESDRRAPVLEGLSFSPPEIQDGAVSVLGISVSDDLSGVKSVTGTLVSPSEAAVVTFTAHGTEGAAVFSSALTIPKRAETGDWFVGTLLITDRAGNPLSLSFKKGNVPQGGSLRVISADSDSAPPTLRNIVVERGTVNPGDKNVVVIEVEDDRSGVASVTGAFQNRTKTALIPFTGRAASEPMWKAEVGIPDNADCGEWTLRHLMLTDQAKNNVVLDSSNPIVGRAGFLVAGGGPCDSEPPVLSGLYFTPSVVSNAVGGEIVLTIRIQDDGSGIASVFGRIEGPAGPNGQAARIPFECIPDPSDPDHQMMAKVTVPQYAARGVWSVIWLHATDKARNAHPYYKGDPALSGGTFTVE